MLGSSNQSLKTKKAQQRLLEGSTKFIQSIQRRKEIIYPLT
jgi:hypothetical protein